jgi:hypothetical protein
MSPSGEKAKHERLQDQKKGPDDSGPLDDDNLAETTTPYTHEANNFHPPRASSEAGGDANY